MSIPWPIVQLHQVIWPRKEFIVIDDLAAYKRARVQLHVKGIVQRDQVLGALIKTKQQQVCRVGDFLVAEIDAKVGGFGIVPDCLDGAIVSSHYFLFVIDETQLDKRFLDYFLRTPAFRNQVEAQGSTNYAAIRSGDVLGYEMPLPPLPEQRRIVIRIEELGTHISEASSLHCQAQTEADALLGAELGAKFAVLAKSCPVESLENLSSHILDGPHVTPGYLPAGASGIPFVTVKNMVSGRLDFGHLNYISEDDHRLFTRRCKAERGDVLYSKDGATRGRPCLVDTDREFSYFVSVALIKPLRDKLDGRYLEYVLNSNWIKDRMADRSRGDMIPHIVLREIRAFPIPVPTLAEQCRIVAELDRLQTEVNALKRLQAEAATEIEALMPSVLSRAFAGEL
jgi:type I restriction enzyme S subunit